MDNKRKYYDDTVPITSLIGAILRDTHNDPFYYLCECAQEWAELGRVNPLYVYELRSRGTAFTKLPFTTYKHQVWERLNKKRRAIPDDTEFIIALKEQRIS